MYTDGFKPEGKNIQFVTVFKHETVYGLPSVEASIYTAKMIRLQKKQQ